MTLRLDGIVVCGELDNTRPYNVCGWLKIRGIRTPLTLNLTGDCSPKLKGLRIRFETQDNDAEWTAEEGDFESASADLSLLGSSDDDSDSDFEQVDVQSQSIDGHDLSGLAWQQIGPTGQMTFETDATTGRSELSLEWFSQNGRVTLSIENPIVELLTDDEEDEESDAEELATSDQYDSEFDSEDEDPFGLFSSELIDHFDSSAEALDREVLSGRNEDEQRPGSLPTNAEELEDLIENGEGVPIAMIFDPPLRLPRPAKVEDDEIEEPLKKLLARMAEHGIALDVCEHFKPRDVYELLLEDICPFELTHPELGGKNWVQHFSTSDFCDDCEAEFEREFEEYERNRPRDEDDED